MADPTPARPHVPTAARDARLGEVQRRPLAQRLRASSSSGSSARCFNEPHSTKQIEDAIGVGASKPTPETLIASTIARARRAARPVAISSRSPPGALPGAGDHGTERQDHVRTPSAERWPSDGRRAARRWPRRPCPARPQAGAGQPAAARLRRGLGEPGRTARRDRTVHRPTAAPARAVRLARRSGSATPGATSRSPTSCARCIPDLEIDWLAQHPVTARPRGRGRAHPPGQPHLANESGHIESRVGRARPALLPRAGGAWTRS